MNRASAARFDQLQHLRTNPAGPTLAVKSLENQLGCIGHAAGLGGLGSLVEQLGRLIEQLLTRDRFHKRQRRPAAWNRHGRPAWGHGGSHVSGGMTLGG